MASGSSRSLANNNILFYRRRKSGSGSDADFLLLNETQGLALDFTDDFFYASEGFYGSARIKDTGTPANEYNSSPTKAASSLLTYTSPSLKMTMGPSGTLRYGAHNLATYSDDMTQGAYTKSGSTASATQFLETAASATHGVNLTFSGRTVGEYYEFEAEIQGVGRDWVALSINSSSAATTHFQLTGAGTVGTANVVNVVNEITALSDGYYRIKIARFLANASNFPVIYGATQDNATNQVYLGDITKGYNVRNVRFTRGPCDSTFLATSGSARYALPLEWSSAGVLQGLLVEEARTNLVKFSNTSSNVSQYTASNITAADDTTDTLDIYGLNTATKLTFSGGAATHLYYPTDAIAPTAAAHTASIYAKMGTLRYIQFLLDGSSFPALAYANFDLQTGVVTASANLTADIEALPNGWYRLIITATASAVASPCVYVAGLLDGTEGYNPSVNIDGLTAYVQQLQLEPGSFPSSPIETFASTVTRAADRITAATSLGPWSNTNSTFFVEATTQSVAATRAAGCINDGTANERILIRLYDGGTARQFVVTDGGATQANIQPPGQPTINTIYKLAMSQQANLFDAAWNGTLGTQDTSGTMPTVTTLDIGTNIAGEHLNGLVRKVMWLPRKMTPAELQTLTT